MGQFSWISQDTEEPIYESDSRNEAGIIQVVTMLDNKGNKWVEKDYRGYGEFGGKDFFELVAEMNGLKQSNSRMLRDVGIDLVCSGKQYFSPNLYLQAHLDGVDCAWKNEVPQDDPNQGWYQEKEDVDEDWDYSDDDE